MRLKHLQGRHNQQEHAGNRIAKTPTPASPTRSSGIAPAPSKGKTPKNDALKAEKHRALMTRLSAQPFVSKGHPRNLSGRAEKHLPPRVTAYALRQVPASDGVDLKPLMDGLGKESKAISRVVVPATLKREKGLANVVGELLVEFRTPQAMRAFAKTSGAIKAMRSVKAPNVLRLFFGAVGKVAQEVVK